MPGRVRRPACKSGPPMRGFSLKSRSLGRLDSGTTTLNAVADSFIHSPEFVRTYGTPDTVSNSKFVELLYLHTLGREYDQSGFNYWVNKLDTHQTNRGDLLAFFSDSNENHLHTADATANGIWFV